MRRLWMAFLLCGAVVAVGEEVKVLSYNVLHGVDALHRPAMDKQAKIIAKSGAHVVGLQEIDRKCRRSGSVDQPAWYAEATSCEAVFGAFMKFNGGEYGMAMLTRWQLVKKEVVRLPDGREPRVAIVATVKTPEGSLLRVVNVHFDWTTSDLRVAQAKALLEHLDKTDLPTVVLGDYNAEPGSATLKLFEEAKFRFVAKPDDNRFTWSAKEPTIEIDHVAVRDGGGKTLTGLSITVLDEPEASDHRPVFAILKLEDQ